METGNRAAASLGRASLPYGRCLPRGAAEDSGKGVDRSGVSKNASRHDCNSLEIPEG